MQARKGVPKRHVDRRERDSDEALGPEQAEARRQLLLEMGGQQGLAHHKRLEILDEIRDWLERRIGVGEHDAVPELARVRQHIREHQRRFGYRTAGGSMRRVERHAHRPHPQTFDDGQGRLQRLSRDRTHMLTLHVMACYYSDRSI